MIKKLIIGFIALLLLTTGLGKWIILALLILLLLWIIRKLADLFWWGKDKDKW